jgi:NAD(P)-dependent dehydrogenase (short-subunit alcohol dehydrogenase family)
MPLLLGRPASESGRYVELTRTKMASDESSWVTGGIFPVDGGFTAQ